MPTENPEVQVALDALRETARIASVLIDGDEARRIIVDRAYYHIANPSPEHRFLASDYFDVDLAGFLRMKKFLTRLERLVEFPCNAALWVRVKGQEDHVTVACQNGTLHRYYRFGEGKRPIEGEMAACFASGEVTVAPTDHPSGTITVLAPVRNSLADVVALVELTARNAAAQELAPAWS